MISRLANGNKPGPSRLCHLLSALQRGWLLRSCAAESTTSRYWTSFAAVFLRVITLAGSPSPSQSLLTSHVHAATCSLQADVYSFGVILWEVLARKQPFKELNAFAISYQVGTQGRLLSIAEIEDTVAAMPGPNNGASAVKSSHTQESSPDSSATSGTELPPSETGSDTWWKTLLQDCFREACDRPALDRIIATLRDAIAKARPPVPPQMAAQAPATQQHATGLAASSGAPAANSRSEQTTTTVGKTGQVQRDAPA